MAALASWNDSEYAAAAAAPSVNLEGAVDAAQSTFSEHATSGVGGSVGFSTRLADLTPGETVAAPFALRLGAGTTDDATVSLAAVSSTVADLTYQVVQTATPGCTTSTTGTTLVSAGTPVTAVSGAGVISLSKAAGTPTSAAGSPAYLCFKVTAGSASGQDHSGTVTWQLAGTSHEQG